MADGKAAAADGGPSASSPCFALHPCMPPPSHAAAAAAAAGLVQLELLPLRPTPYHPSAAPSPGSPFLPWQRQQRGYASSRGAIDINQTPSTPDCFEAVSFLPGGLDRGREQKLSDSDCEREKGYEMASRIGSDEDETGQPRKKLRLSKEQSALLEDSFKEHSTLNPKQKSTLAEQLSLRPRQVEVWFQNRRARTKLKQTEVECEVWRRWCQWLAEENRRLQKQVEELRAMKASPCPSCVVACDLYMPTLSICPSCQPTHAAPPPCQPSCPPLFACPSAQPFFTHSSVAC